MLRMIHSVKARCVAKQEGAGTTFWSILGSAVEQRDARLPLGGGLVNWYQS